MGKDLPKHTKLHGVRSVRVDGPDGIVHRNRLVKRALVEIRFLDERELVLGVLVVEQHHVAGGLLTEKAVGRTVGAEPICCVAAEVVQRAGHQSRGEEEIGDLLRLLHDLLGLRKFPRAQLAGLAVLVRVVVGHKQRPQIGKQKDQQKQEQRRHRDLVGLEAPGRVLPVGNALPPFDDGLLLGARGGGEIVRIEGVEIGDPVGIELEQVQILHVQPSPLVREIRGSTSLYAISTTRFIPMTSVASTTVVAMMIG